jgi:putative PIN family toxin of toxin-antitoxin system
MAYGKVVLDTNVLVSGLINMHNAPGRIVDQLRTGVVQLIVDDRILGEYRDVLFRERLRAWFTEQDAWDLMTFVECESEIVVASRVIQGLPDPGDAPFLEVALAAHCPLVTGNTKHYPESLRTGVTVFTPAEFITHNV